MKTTDGLTNEERGTCFRGHPWISQNIFVSGRLKKRKCRLCNNIRLLTYGPRERKRQLPKEFREKFFMCGRKNGTYLNHPKTPENTIIRPNGKTVCRMCYDKRDAKRSPNYGMGRGYGGHKPKTPDGLCVFCKSPLPFGRSKYCSTKCQWSDDVSGFLGRAIRYGVLYEQITKRSVFDKD